MTGKERVCAALRRQPVDRTPWVPFVGCHAASLIGKTASEYLRSADLIVEGLSEAVRRYRPDGIPVIFDLQLEAEVLGCDLVWADENPPAVSGHPLAQGRSLADLRIPLPSDGRIPMVLSACRELRSRFPDIALYGLITGPFTLAMHLLGTDVFMKMYDEPEVMRRLMTFTREVCEAMASYYMREGCDVIAMVDPMTSQIGPDMFREFVTPYVAPLFDAVRKQGRQGSFFVCGQAQQNVEAMCECRPDNISVDENIPLDYVRKVCLAHEISFGGNLQLTVVLLLGTPEEAQRNAVACMEIGGTTGFVLAPGCDLPFGTPPANLVAVAEIVANPYRAEVVKTLASTRSEQALLNLREYGMAEKVIVDIITLDSEACAPCQYMVEAVQKVAPEFEGIVEWREHKIKYKESLVFMTSLMVKNIPTICIDGKITFVSRIPPRDELIAALQRRINEKLRLMIRQKRASLLVLGHNETECGKVRAHISQAMRELGEDFELQVTCDEHLIHSYGVSRLPAVVLTRHQIKSEGLVPEVAVVKEWIKDL